MFLPFFRFSRVTSAYIMIDAVVMTHIRELTVLSEGAEHLSESDVFL